MPDLPELMTRRETMKALRFRRADAITRMVSRGDLTGIRIGNRLLIKRASVERLLAKRR